MSFLQDQAVRLIRTKWKNKVDPFAQELFSIFLGDEAIVADSPVQLDKPPGSTLNFTGGTIGDFTVNGSTVSNGPVTFNNPFQFDPSQTTLFDSSGGTEFQGGGFTVGTGDINFNDYIDKRVADALKNPPPDQSAFPTNIAMGQVVSGSGKTYQVNPFPNGPTQISDPPVSAFFPMLVDTEKLDPGTWVIVFAYDLKSVPDTTGRTTTIRTFAGFIPTWMDAPP